MASQRLVDLRFPHLCPAAGCTRAFSTAKGLNTHLANARSCSWYRKGKLSELRAFTGSDAGDTVDQEAYPADEDPVGVLEDFHREMFEFIPLHAGTYLFVYHLVNLIHRLGLDQLTMTS
jgi:hypothetical protein